MRGTQLSSCIRPITFRLQMVKQNTVTIFVPLYYVRLEGKWY